jgi:hypothetical protein
LHQTKYLIIFTFVIDTSASSFVIAAAAEANIASFYAGDAHVVLFLVVPLI